MRFKETKPDNKMKSCSRPSSLALSPRGRNGVRTSWVIAALVFGLEVVANAAVQTPAGRIDYALAYFPPASGLIMQGGWGPTWKWEPMAETWELDAAGWTILPASGAPSLAHHSMAYDAGRQVLLVCGKSEPYASRPFGYGEFDGTRWTSMTNGPLLGLGDAELAYDSVRHRIVLYWAQASTASGGRIETWEYDGAKWQLMNPGQLPVACSDGALLKYHAGLQRVVLVGQHGTAPVETWLWDGSNWSPLTGPQPTNAVTGGMAYDQARGEMVVLTTDMATWTLKSNAWVRQTPAHSPAYRKLAYFSMDYDPQRQVSAFFGGEAYAPLSYPNTTWEWNGTDWHVFTPGVVPPAAPKFVNVAVSATNLFGCSLQGASSQSYRVQVSPDFKSRTDWTNLVMGDVALPLVDGDTTNNSHRFFRAVTP